MRREWRPAGQGGGVLRVVAFAAVQLPSGGMRDHVATWLQTLLLRGVSAPGGPGGRNPSAVRAPSAPHELVGPCPDPDPGAHHLVRRLRRRRSTRQSSAAERILLPVSSGIALTRPAVEDGGLVSLAGIAAAPSQPPRCTSVDRSRGIGDGCCRPAFAIGRRRERAMSSASSRYRCLVLDQVSRQCLSSDRVLAVYPSIAAGRPIGLCRPVRGMRLVGIAAGAQRARSPQPAVQPRMCGVTCARAARSCAGRDLFFAPAGGKQASCCAICAHRTALWLPDNLHGIPTPLPTANQQKEATNLNPQNKRRASK